MKKVSLVKKRILYIGFPWFSYDKCLIKKMIDLGATVTSYDIEKLNAKDLYSKIINKLKPENKEKHKNHYYNQILSANNYDYVLVKHGYQFDLNFFPKLRKANPTAKFINFHWDSIRPQFDYLPIIKYFDTIFSFDIKDCNDHPEIKYLPLFYLDIYKEFEENHRNDFSKKENDLLFIGSWRNMERYQLINLTERLCKEAGLTFRHYLYYSLQNQFQYIKKGIIPKKARSKRLSHNQILKLFNNSNTIIDFPSSFQTGLTIRTFETLAAGKKLITTNKNIINEPFYNPEFIDIIDMNDFTLNIDFIKHTPTTSMDEKIKNYSIENYIYKLLQD